MKLKPIALLFSIVALIQSSTYALEPSKTINLTKETEFYLLKNRGISNNLFVIESKFEKKFFEECKKKLSMFDTVKRAIVEYFNDNYKSEQQSMIKSLSNEENLNKFFHMKTYGDGQAAKWLSSLDKSDTSALGLTEPLPDKFKKEKLPDFLRYAFAESFQYRFNKNIEIGEIQINQALNNLATRRIAKLLNLSELIVKTKYVKIMPPDKLGIIMDCAPGMSFKDFSLLKNKGVNPSLQRNLSNLMILDAICSQRDRAGGIGNLFVQLDANGNAVSITGFDNDMSFDKFENLKEKYATLPPVILSNNKIALPYMDKSLANKILSLNYEDIYSCLKDLLPNAMIDAVAHRLQQIQEAIKNSIEGNESFLLEPGDWNEKTMMNETTVDNETYFKTFIKKLN